MTALPPARLGWSKVRLGDVCEFRYGKSLPAGQRSGSGYPVFGSNGEVGRHDRALTSGATVVVGRKGSFGEVCYSDEPCWPIDTTYFIDEGSTEADLRWLFHLLSLLPLKDLNRAAAIPGLNREDAYDLPVVLPPPQEQRRIAALLDAADALRAKRHLTLATLDTLTQSIFVDMFGVLDYDRTALGELLTRPLRNGISPAKSGKHVARVLTLSAITGGRFNDAAVKESTFTAAHSGDKLVSASDFLICRGNGNLTLVGRGAFPTTDMPAVAFPDTMIAATFDRGRIAPGYLEHVWPLRVIREQIERSARTTNGTYKVNQQMIEAIELPLPPMADQEEFAFRRQRVRVEAERHRESAALLDTLFASLQQRASRGDL